MNTNPVMTHPGIRVLVAEDDALIVSAIRDELESAGLRVGGTARNGRDAVAMVIHPAASERAQRAGAGWLGGDNRRL